MHREIIFEALDNAMFWGYRDDLASKTVDEITYEIVAANDDLMGVSCDDVRPHVWAWLEQGGLA